MARDGFHDILFPEAAAVGAVASVERRTDIAGLASGREVRRGRWSASLRSWALRTGVLEAGDAAALVAFFEARQGRRYAFRFRDPLDHSSGSDSAEPTDQVIGTGNGVQTLFPLVKRYGQTVRAIELADAASVRVAFGGSEQPTGWTYTMDGILFDAPPEEGTEVSAGFLFDVPVRFGEDRLALKLAARGAAPEGLSLREVRLA